MQPAVSPPQREKVIARAGTMARGGRWISTRTPKGACDARPRSPDHCVLRPARRTGIRPKLEHHRHHDRAARRFEPLDDHHRTDRRLEPLDHGTEQTGVSGPSATWQHNASVTADTRQKIAQSLEQSGFKDIRVTPEAFVIHAQAPDGSRVVMLLRPDQVTGVIEQSGSSSEPNGTSSAPNGSMPNGSSSSEGGVSH